MRNKFLTTIFILVTQFFLFTPANAANDIPMLTWERGKEQNIVLGGYTNESSWKILLINESEQSLEFSKSRRDANGYFVYSILLPDDLPAGAYRIEARGLTNEANIVAGVNVVESSYFEIVRAPTQLFLILLALIFILSTLSTIRIQKYQELSFLQLSSQKELPKPLDSFYRLRRGALTSVKNSLFKHVMIREGETLYKLSPNLWSLLPILSFLVGSYAGIVTESRLGIPEISAFLFFGMALIGIFDPYSGFTATVGFGLLQAMQGDISSIRSIGSLVALGLIWMAPGLFATLYQEVLAKDIRSKLANSILPRLISSFIGTYIFYTLDILLRSLLDRTGPISNTSYYSLILIFVTILLKDEFSRAVDKRALLSEKELEVKTLLLKRVISPRATLILMIFMSGVFYTWTISPFFSIFASALFVLPLLLLQVRFANPVFRSLSKLRRNILVESLLVSILFGVGYFFIQSLPFEALEKGRLIIIAAVVPLILHAIYSSFSDTQERALQVTQ